MTSPTDFNTQLIEEFRANGGETSGPFKGRRLLLLTSTGAKSGQQRTTPLVYSNDGDASSSSPPKAAHPSIPPGTTTSWLIPKLSSKSAQRSSRCMPPSPASPSATASTRSTPRRCPPSTTTKRRPPARFPSSSSSAHESQGQRAKSKERCRHASPAHSWLSALCPSLERSVAAASPSTRDRLSRRRRPLFALGPSLFASYPRGMPSPRVAMMLR